MLDNQEQSAESQQPSISELFLELREDLVGHLGAKAVEDFKHK